MSIYFQTHFYQPSTKSKLTPSIGQRSQRIGLSLRRLLGLLWIQESVGKRLELVVTVATPLLEVGQVVDHIGVGSLPRGRARVVVHVVDATAGVNATLPAIDRKRIYDKSAL